ncbi:Mitochondrial peroxiredoxin PRX1 [Wickerhamomyces ciferrii]|uniref:Mitochondrial peroxiredoxin PRX1 n=1 Tax=Wickerhamomyces ciferrii (strain ATCC 14091 / BCRC 22168 / CBS 111 / JCM 3599 / NBRC 0793 / NRRL Y-1031 F-60-10) TaxID=1206466 RepID=K0KT29_WICCF|nr:Mitochondrial peroxiredoxin PRX1 [Wickerhamomyces ciferrii]CCH45197.1 Mitochondrial peroxiredoxin PRX1 [Wickerhamomyces ciferrii]
MFTRSILRTTASVARTTRVAPRATPIFTRGVRTFKQEDQPRLRIGSVAPNFKTQTTQGPIDFHEYVGDSWVVFFSHPADFTPVCTTELGAFAALQEEFTKRNTKLIGLSAEGLESHNAWVKDIEEVSKLDKFSFPIIADTDKEVSFLYDMVDEEGFKNLNGGIVQTIRSVYVIDPSKKIRISFTYPPSVGRNSAEVLRVIDALQLTEKRGVVTPIDWTEGKDVIIPPSVTDEAAKEKFGDFTKVKPYLRFTKA